MGNAEQFLEPLLDWAEHAHYEEFPDDVIAHAHMVLMDQLAALWAGRREREVVGIARWAHGRHALHDPMWLGLALGVSAVALELDEGHRESMGHPGSHIVPTLLAFIHGHQDVTIRDIVAALIIGYEVAARVASAGTPRPGSHPHGTWGTIGAAVARAVLTGERETLRQVVQLSAATGFATSFSAPLAGRTVRNLYAGLSALMGVLACEWKDSVTGIFAPTETLFSSWNGEGIDSDLGRRYAITQNYFKTLAACRYVHGTIEAIEALRRQQPFGPADVEGVTVETYSPAHLLSGLPFNTLSSKFSIPFAVLRAIEGRGYDNGTFHEPLNLSEADQAWMDRVDVVHSKDMTNRLPNIRATRVVIRLTDKSELTEEVPLPLGEWDRPHPPIDLAKKWSALLSDYPKALPTSPVDLTVSDLNQFVASFIKSVLED